MPSLFFKESPERGSPPLRCPGRAAEAPRRFFVGFPRREAHGVSGLRTDADVGSDRAAPRRRIGGCATAARRTSSGLVPAGQAM